MLRREENERITRCGPGTPMGDVFRRYWLPALMSTELPEPDGAPVRVRMLGEDLVAFRDTEGSVGLVGAFCPHRRAPMFFGRNERRGLRCTYHGWKFDRTGSCVDMPTEPPESNYKAKVSITAYPTWEGAGMVWAYMGPSDQMPPPPDWELVRAPQTHRFVSKTLQDCNYLQALEGGLDSAHALILHNGAVGDLSWIEDHESLTPRLQVERTPYGFQYQGNRVRGGKHWIRLYQYFMPVTQVRGRVAPLRGGKAPPKVPTMNGHIWVPVDDVTTAVYNFMYSADPVIPLPMEVAIESEIDDGRGPEDVTPDFRLRRNLSNDYMIDRNMQKGENFTGIVGINTQDVAIQEGMGPIVDRSQEHLGATDIAIVTARRLLLEAADAVAAGQSPRGHDTASYRDIRAVDHIVEDDALVSETIERERRARF
jgi:phenylpropionate dioxygenase-like ring-hydroxylating dioxygenase large terminal subunit